MLKTEYFFVRVTPLEKAAVQQLAQDNRDQSRIVRLLLREGLERRGLWPPARVPERQAAGGP